MCCFRVSSFSSGVVAVSGTTRLAHMSNDILVVSLVNYLVMMVILIAVVLVISVVLSDEVKTVVSKVPAVVDLIDAASSWVTVEEHPWAL